MSCLPPVSGSKTEISELGKPELWRRSTICSAWPYDLAIQKTDVLDITCWCVCSIGWFVDLFCSLHFELVLDLRLAGSFTGQLLNLGFLRRGLNRTAQSNHAVGRDDLYVLGGRAQ